MATATLTPVRKTRTARPMTPVRITERHRSLSTGRAEAWAAVSADGTWSFERLDMPGTPWKLTHVPTGKDCGWFGSLPKARRAVADGSALAAVKPPVLTRHSPGQPELDPDDEYLYAQERADCEEG